MKIQRVYIDTSVIGGCFDPEFAPWSNGLMKDFRLGNFKPVISEIIAAEIFPAPPYVQEKYAELLEFAPDLAELTDDAKILSAAYREREIVPVKYANDMLHIALATVSGADIVVSWNFKHIVHYEKIRKFNAVNREQGYRQIEIYSPREVTNYEERD